MAGGHMSESEIHLKNFALVSFTYILENITQLTKSSVDVF